MSEAGASVGGESRPETGQSASRVVRVLCVEDLRPVAEAICDGIDAERGLKSVGTLDSPDHLLAEVRQKTPDIVLLDLYYGGRDAFGQLAALREASPETKVIVVSGDNHPDTIKRAFSLGARGYVVKSDLREVIAAIKAVAGGGTWRPGDFEVTPRSGREVEDIIDAMIAALGDPVSGEEGAWAWQVGRLRVDVRADSAGGVIIDLPWPLRSVADPPSFGDLHEEAGGEVKLRFAVHTRAALDLVLGVIVFEGRGG